MGDEAGARRPGLEEALGQVRQQNFLDTGIKKRALQQAALERKPYTQIHENCYLWGKGKTGGVAKALGHAGNVHL